MISKSTFLNFTKVFLIALFFAVSAQAAATGVDISFDAAAYSSLNGQVRSVVVQPDGKILIGGHFSIVSGIARAGIARLNADGSVDTSFNPPEIYSGNGIAGGINAVGLQTNGKIILGGNALTIDGGARRLIRLNADGSLDTSFYDYGGSIDRINDLKVMPNDKIVIG
ncbi:MAG TPA: delta-60 repeat domain-containing protein, partial [Pyrinomonadaceae bacterium]